MKTGTNVGQIYVKATVDASSMNDDIVDGVDSAGPDIEKSGKEQGDRYAEAFGEMMEDRLEPIMERLGNALSRRLSRRVGEGLRGAFDDKSANSLGARLGDALGETLANRIEDTLAGIEDRIASAVKNGGGGASGGGGGTAQGGASGNGQQLYKSYDFYALFESARIKLREKANEAILKDEQDLVKAQQALYDKAQKEAIKRDDDLWRVRRATAKAYSGYLADLEKQESKRQAGVSGNSNFASQIGKMFGMGSRNNFLNLVGKSLSNAINLQQAFSKGLTNMTGLGGAGSSAFSSLAVSLTASAAAMGVVALAAAVLVSVMGALLALATALVATITSGLVGGLLVLGSTLAVVATAAGLVTLAFTSMTDAQRELLNANFRPLKEALTGLGQLVLEDLIPYFSVWADNLMNALVMLAPLASTFGDAMGQAGAILTAAFSGPGFTMFVNALNSTLPNGMTRLNSITVSLSRALSGFLNGTMGIVTALLPLVSRFADYLARVGERFEKWANSAQGQNSIVDFADRAVESLMSLWNFTREFFGFLADVLFSSEAQAVGNNMFDVLADSFAGFRQAIADGSLEKWFEDAIEFGSALWKVMGALGDTIGALYDSGVISASASAMGTFADAIGHLNDLLGPTVDIVGSALPFALAAALTPLQTVVAQVVSMGEALEWVGGLLNKITPGNAFGNGAEWGNAGDAWKDVANPWMNALNGGSGGGGGNPFSSMFDNLTANVKNYKPPTQGPKFTMPDLTSLGASALANTGKSSGGRKPDYVNPYTAWANQLIKDGPSVAAQIRNAVLTVNKQVAAAIRSAAQAGDVASARNTLNTSIASIRTSGAQMVNSAQDALSNAARTLANATSEKAAAKALREVRRAQKNLEAAIKNQERMGKAVRRLAAQRVVTPKNVNALLNGVKVQNATLADYAAARDRLATRMEKANQKLADAIALRDNYKAAVIASVKDFGSLMTAQAKTVNGIEQALTATDITSNLQDRLAKIRKFQANLNILLAQGLSNAAYQQLIDAGVEQGGAYAEALVQGGQGAVAQTNSLVGQIDATANALGVQASNRLYQAGVDAAQGLVDGLTSLSAQLDSAAVRLGNAIARAIKKSLGIKSPSRVMIASMEEVGNGLEDGLDNQHRQVERAANRLSSKIAIAPSMEVARYQAEESRKARVSGNSDDPRFRDLIVHTPTENPKAVAFEVLAEVTGRLPG